MALSQPTIFYNSAGVMRDFNVIIGVRVYGRITDSRD